MYVTRSSAMQRNMKPLGRRHAGTKTQLNYVRQEEWFPLWPHESGRPEPEFIRLQTASVVISLTVFNDPVGYRTDNFIFCGGAANCIFPLKAACPVDDLFYCGGGGGGGVHLRNSIFQTFSGTDSLKPKQTTTKIHSLNITWSVP